MASPALQDWAMNQIRNLFPLDDVSMGQLIAYIMSLSSEREISNYLVDLLGDSPDLRAFIDEFCGKIRTEEDQKIAPMETRTTSNSTTIPPSDAKSRSPRFSNKSVPKRFETGTDDGNDGGKNRRRDRHLVPSKSSDVQNSPSTSREPVPSHPQRSTIGSAGKLTSDLGRTSKRNPDARSKSTKGPVITKVNALSEIDAALKEMELEKSTSQNKKEKKCDCQARRHPLNPLTPNCLHCGKISCLAEGSGPCTFCGKPMLSKQERQEIIKELKLERSQIKMQQGNKKKTPASNKTSTWAQSAGNVNSPIPAQDEERLREMEERKDRLLEYDRTSAGRSKIIDEAADFNDIPTTDKWASPAERALQLKRQQRALRALEKKKRKIMNLDLATQKVTYLYQTDDSESEVEVLGVVELLPEKAKDSLQERPEVMLRFIPSSENSLCFEPNETTQRLRESKWQRVLYDDD
ncbi:hypothetical protein NEOLI_002276 [Neolecta irregularis DAH-3]|uniref:Uncharacterized protein n=1 Tax=Neolecta irregularis (strain DAH-3) TaxID=1198029 RepID=A0A1U7LKQ6_NEOID|nr:hypothetical protein NEOLI_002276 [Neolecta irregularis DAH-3]|eukprot:OLL23234.1 hypothetical protein NEOLI_002276 [Neolecta irregularis DAH-3]